MRQRLSPWVRALLPCLALALASPALWAQSVTLSGMLGSKALLIVDGAAPKGVGVGDTYKGVKVVATQGNEATLEVNGKQYKLRVGEAPANVSATGANGKTIVLMAGRGGHFTTAGLINGSPVPMVVDTGASMVSISVNQARAMGLKFQTAEMGQASTANGVIRAWKVKLDSVRVGNVVVNDVDAMVTEGAMPSVLLGNSFLTRFQMNRTNDQLVLEKIY